MSFSVYSVDQKCGKKLKSWEKVFWLSILFQPNLANLQPVATVISTGNMDKWEHSLLTTNHNLYEEYKGFVQVALFNASPPSVAYMCQWTGWALDQVMACRLFGAQPLPEPMLAYCQLDSREQI